MDKAVNHLTAKSPQRVVIEAVFPEIDAGRFPCKGIIGETIPVTADIFADGQDILSAVLKYRHAYDQTWQETPMLLLKDDRWKGQFSVEKLGTYEYTIEAWINAFASWRKEIIKKIDAGLEIASELLQGEQLIRQTVQQAETKTEEDFQDSDAADISWLTANADALAKAESRDEKIKIILDEHLAKMMDHFSDRSAGTTFEPALSIIVERELAEYAAWYEMFPRSTCYPPIHSATLRETMSRLPEIAAMGFDILYLPPIHPIGKSSRKGPNNTKDASENDPGSPWAIGAKEGGHKSLHPDLGSLEDFDAFLAAAKDTGLEVALDLAFQCSPDHPYVKEHPDWFRHRPDGSIKYAENPPKKYEDIYPLNFECADWKGLWEELKGVVLFWINRGVKIFRVDNPHTKPFLFWEWLLKEVRGPHPDTIFLSEAFARPKVMKYLAKVGFSQSYTYFTWRNTKTELQNYFTELLLSPIRVYFRPNLFVNTPDILHEYLQFGGRAGFLVRLVLAATLGASYGIYGPPFELCENRSLEHSEEYMDSEKYQIRLWDWNKAGNIKKAIALVNKIRRENPALHSNKDLQFFPIDNENIVFYGKTSPDYSNIILVAVNLDPHHVQSGWVRIPLSEWGLEKNVPYQVHELIGDAHYLWHGDTNFVQLDPNAFPAHIFRVRRKIKTERDFDYFL